MPDSFLLVPEQFSGAERLKHMPECQRVLRAEEHATDSAGE